MYRTNILGDKMPPCRTPFDIVKKREVEPPHLMHNYCCCWIINIYVFLCLLPSVWIQVSTKS